MSKRTADRQITQDILDREEEPEEVSTLVWGGGAGFAAGADTVHVLAMMEVHDVYCSKPWSSNFVSLSLSLQAGQFERASQSELEGRV